METCSLFWVKSRVLSNSGKNACGKTYQYKNAQLAYHNLQT